MKGSVLVRKSEDMQREAEMQKCGPSKMEELSSCPCPLSVLAKIPTLRVHDTLHVLLTNPPLCLSEFW